MCLHTWHHNTKTHVLDFIQPRTLTSPIHELPGWAAPLDSIEAVRVHGTVRFLQRAIDDGVLIARQHKRRRADTSWALGALWATAAALWVAAPLRSAVEASAAVDTRRRSGHVAVFASAALHAVCFERDAWSRLIPILTYRRKKNTHTL